MSGQDRWLSGSFVLTPLFSQLASSTIDLFPSRLRNCSSSWIDRFPRNLIGSWILISIIFSTLSGLVSLRSTQIRRGCCASNGVNTHRLWTRLFHQTNSCIVLDERVSLKDYRRTFCRFRAKFNRELILIFIIFSTFSDLVSLHSTQIPHGSCVGNGVNTHRLSRYV